MCLKKEKDILSLILKQQTIQHRITEGNWNKYVKSR